MSDTTLQSGQVESDGREAGDGVPGEGGGPGGLTSSSRAAAGDLRPADRWSQATHARAALYESRIPAPSPRPRSAQRRTYSTVSAVWVNGSVSSAHSGNARATGASWAAAYAK